MSKDYISDISKSIKPSSIRRIFNLANEMDNVISFGIGEPDFKTAHYILKAAEDAMNSGVTHYTANAGFIELRELVSAKLMKENHIAADPKNEIIITAGGMGGLYLALRSVINPGDEVLLPQPSWLNYVSQISLAGGKVVPIPLERADGFSLTADEIEKYISPKTKAIIINTPNNPTGRIIKGKELYEIADLAVGSGIFIISDEVYEKFIWDNNTHISIASFPCAKDITVTINSLSKSYAMTGWRIGYATGNSEVIASMVKLQENIYACASSVSQKAAMAALGVDNEAMNLMLVEYAKRRNLMIRKLLEIPGIKIIPGEGSFYLFVDISGTGYSSEDFAMNLLKEKKVAVIPGDAFGLTGSGFIRVAFTVNTDSIREGTQRMKEFILR